MSNWTVRSTKSWPGAWETVTPFETEVEALVEYDALAERIRRDGGCVELVTPDGERAGMTWRKA